MMFSNIIKNNPNFKKSNEKKSSKTCYKVNKKFKKDTKRCSINNFKLNKSFKCMEICPVSKNN